MSMPTVGFVYASLSDAFEYAFLSSVITSDILLGGCAIHCVAVFRVSSE